MAMANLVWLDRFGLQAEIMRYAMAIEPESNAESATPAAPGNGLEMKPTTV